MIWEIEGADGSTGQDIRRRIEANNRDDALRLAKDQGIFVSQLRQISTSTSGGTTLVHSAKQSNSFLPLLKRFIVFGFLFLIIAAGTFWQIAKRNPPVATAVALPTEPLSSFKAFSARFVSNLQKLSVDYPYVLNGPYASTARHSFNSEYSIDLEKTSSLVTPLVGTLTLKDDFASKTIATGENAVSWTAFDSIQFGLQDEKWILIKGDVTFHHDDGTANSYDIFTDREHSQEAKLLRQTALQTDSAR